MGAPLQGDRTMLHEKREELHGITVVVRGTSGRTYLGRFHETTERGLAMRDLAVHDPAASEHDLDAWLERARKFGVPVGQRLFVVPQGEVAEVVRFAELGE
jgi:hypothetical protein